MQNLQRLLFWIALLASIGLLVGGFCMTGLWLEAGLSLLPALALGFAFRKKSNWQGTAGLVGTAALSAVGMLLRAPALCMIGGSAAALAAWDLANFDRSMQNGFSSPAGGRIERQHVNYLGAALGLGVGLALAGSLLALQLPFIGMVLLIGVAFFSLDRVALFSKKK